MCGNFNNSIPAICIVLKTRLFPFSIPGATTLIPGRIFSEARLKIGAMEWAGQVEIHLKSSDWLRHGHQTDSAYGNVILHVVYEHDRRICNPDGSSIPTIELKDRINSDQLRQYQHLKHEKSGIACESQLAQVPPVFITSTIDRMVLERMERKTKGVTAGLKTNQSDWEMASFRLLAKAFGMKNQLRCFSISSATSVPLNKLTRHNQFQKEALIFGLAGFLEDVPLDKYQEDLQKEFKYLSQKLNLKSRLSRHHWKYSRLRPGNFPTTRLSQLCAILQKETRLFQRFVEATRLEEIRALLVVPVNHYWSSHYDFNKKSKRKLGPIGATTLDSVVINAIAPLLISYGHAIDDSDLVEKAISWLEKTKPENNSISRKWTELGVSNLNALESQGLLQLYQEYCTRKRCLQCSIGNKILSAS